MKNLSHLNEYRTLLMGDMGDEHNGAFILNLKGSNLSFIAAVSAIRAGEDL